MPMPNGKRNSSSSASVNALLEVDAGVGRTDWNPEENDGAIKKRQPVIVAYRTTFIWIAVCILVAVTCAMIPSAFLLARNNDCSSVKSMSNLADQLVDLQNMVWSMRNTMQIQKDSLTSFFEVNFVSFGNRSVEYALVDMHDRITWNQADLFCKSIQAKLAYPDANILTSVGDLKQACVKTNASCCACWVGLTKQLDEKVWQTSDGDDAVTTEKMWAPGQEFVKKHPDYDCAYIFDGLLYSMYCTGNSSQNHSETVVAERFVCETLVQP